MSASRRRLVGGLVALTVAAACGTALSPAPASAAAEAATYTVTVGTKGSWTHPNDTPAAPYIDKDGTFYFQQAHALYGASDSRKWDFFSGTNFDTATRSSAISDAVNPANSNDRNNDTTWRCNNSPTGLESTYAPATSGYAQRNYCDLAGVWVDPDTGDWYGLVHNEFTPQPFGDGLHFDAIDYAVSKDQGRTWSIKDHVITSPYSTTRGDTTAFPQQTYDYGDGDQRLFVDTASGYFYAFYGSRIVNKGGGWGAFYSHVARAPIADKMAPASWQKWYNGSWSQPGKGGKESNMVPVGATSTTGYTPPAKEYNPRTSGSISQQVAAGTMPATSPMFVMDITYNAYLGLYIGEPQAVDQSGNASQEIYATDDLTKQKWFRLGDTGSYKNASWYRWFLDSVNRTGSGIVGKNFRSYCSFGCSGGTSSEYVNLSIESSAPAAPVDTTKTYRIAGANGQVLTQVAGGTATSSVPVATGSSLESWVFTSNGDGSHRIANAATGQLLGVDSSTTTSRAWGAKPTVTTMPTGGPTVGQQWFVIPGASATDDAPTGSYRLVNRYSGLVIGLSNTAGRLTETTPTRTWTNTTGNAVGGTRTANEQVLSLTETGAAAPTLNGNHTLVTGGKALDNPDHSTTLGTQFVTWTPTGGANQSWRFTQQADGSYEVVNVESGLCADVESASTTAGAKVIQWTCNGGTNQRWRVTSQTGGTYKVASVRSGLLLTTASTANGALVTQQTDTGSTLQLWSIN
ncbi:RICIN domain-containing protein [Streptomyces tanashiensis]|uniref:RICIN domain-containing protein n=1 Tax=Streptomyces tanashiensis TaxID=67367 RepID=A0ABY6QV71_9ACTN|nr:RICIN domain-containing protein [Streptomyces tanashiensis]UZX20562.1 RICIN domain-containing protein [Streptomyces tanashiensis]